MKLVLAEHIYVDNELYIANNFCNNCRMIMKDNGYKHISNESKLYKILKEINETRKFSVEEYIDKLLSTVFIFYTLD